jgi:exodeoxyribonuclease V beta subunit
MRASATGVRRTRGTPASRALVGGTEFGTLVHRVLQEVDFADADLERALGTEVDRELRFSGLGAPAPELVSGLRAVIETPLGVPLHDLRLADFNRRDHLDELGFELHLGGSGPGPLARDIGRLLSRHPLGDRALEVWADLVADGRFDVALSGHLTGSIDLVLRVRDPLDPGAPERFVIADYKTNILGARTRPPNSTDYEPDRLGAEMAASDYPLQALLYSVALHRYLRSRIVDYRPEERLGGVAYLFVRGMVGPATPVSQGRRSGVFFWDLPALLIVELSDLLDGRGMAR